MQAENFNNQQSLFINPQSSMPNAFDSGLIDD
jgi:hypothetical protein